MLNLKCLLQLMFRACNAFTRSYKQPLDLISIPQFLFWIYPPLFTDRMVLKSINCLWWSIHLINRVGNLCAKLDRNIKIALSMENISNLHIKKTTIECFSHNFTLLTYKFVVVRFKNSIQLNRWDSLEYVTSYHIVTENRCSVLY